MTTIPLDIDALNRISECGGFISIEGHDVPLVRPIDPATDQMLFDRACCDAGLKMFVRPIFPGEVPPELSGEGAEYLLVRELADGIRVKLPVWCVWLDPERN